MPMYIIGSVTPGMDCFRSRNRPRSNLGNKLRFQSEGNRATDGVAASCAVGVGFAATSSSSVAGAASANESRAANQASPNSDSVGTLSVAAWTGGGAAVEDLITHDLPSAP